MTSILPQWLSVVLGHVLVTSILLAFCARALAPIVVRRWPDSWLDKVLAFLIRTSTDVIGAVGGIRHGLGLSAPLVIPDIERARLEMIARQLWEGVAFGASVRSWSELSDEEKAPWIEAAGGAVRTAKGVLRKAPAPPPLPPAVLVLVLLCGCAGADVERFLVTAIDAHRASEPVLARSYQREQEACLALAPKTEAQACVNRVRKEWAPVVQAQESFRRMWCTVLPPCDAKGAVQ